MTDDILKHMLSEDEFLEHYGKKGMKWGERKEARYQQRFDKELTSLKARTAGYQSRYSGKPKAELKIERARLQKKIDKLDINGAVSGLGLLGHFSKTPKVYDQALKRNEKTPYQKLSAAEKNALTIREGSAAKNRAIAKLLVRGGTEVGIVAAIGTLGVSKLKISDANKLQTRVGIASLLIPISGVRIQEIKQVSQAAKFKELTTLRGEIDKELEKP